MRSRRWWWGLVVAYATFVLIGSLVPVTPSLSPGHLDKVEHLGEYLLFAWLLVQAIRLNHLRQREYLTLAWIYATSYGLLMELLQIMVPWRSAELLDAVANAVGAAIGVWLGAYFPRSSS